VKSLRRVRLSEILVVAPGKREWDHPGGISELPGIIQHAHVDTHYEDRSWSSIDSGRSLGTQYSRLSQLVGNEGKNIKR
jgi:hypothetical protein